MIENLNEYYIDANIMQINSEQLTARSVSIERFIEEINREKICCLVSLYYNIACDDEFITEYVDCFKQDDQTFSSSYKKEISLLAGVTLLQVVKTTRDYDSFVELLVVINRFYHENIPSIMVYDEIYKQFNEDRLELRRSKVDINEEKQVLQEFKKKMEKEDWQNGWTKSFLDAAIGQHEADQELRTMLCKQISVYKEDSNVLWWMTNLWCETLNKPFKAIEKKKACLIMGEELAVLISNLPGPYAAKNVLTTSVEMCKGRNTAESLPAVLETTDKTFKNSIIESIKKQPFSKLLPIHEALILEQNTDNSEQWYPKYTREILEGKDFTSVVPSEYAWRFYLERLAICSYKAIS